MRKTWLLGVGAIILALGPIAVGAGADSGGGYSNESLQGDYFCNEVFFIPTGLVNGDLKTFQAGLTSLQHFDGHGNYSETFSDYNAFRGTLLCTWAASGTYTVNPDGTGSESDTGTSTISGCESPIDSHLRFIVENHGTRYDFLDEVTGTGVCLRSE